jgi:hypothetical protein
MACSATPGACQLGRRVATNIKGAHEANRLPIRLADQRMVQQSVEEQGRAQGARNLSAGGA